MGARRAKEASKKKRQSKLFSAIGAVLCVIFGVLLVFNLTIIIKGTLNPDMPPSVLGITPMATLSGSMSGTQEGHIEVGDLIFIGKAEPETLKAGDVIAYMQGETVIAHRIIEVQPQEDGSIQWITKGDANDTPDSKPVKESQLVGIYKSRIPKLGDFALFMQKPVGMLIFIGIPVLAFLAWDAYSRRKQTMSQKKKQEQMQEELKRLRELAGEGKDSAGE